MRLFTSSFRTFVGQSIVVGLGLSLLYALAIQVIQPKVTFAQNQYQKNMIFAQDFIYLKQKPSKVIVGSSMATRMKFDKADEVYNLAFGGGGPLTGLEIIRQSGFIPKMIFIESNVFSMAVDKVFLDSLFRPVLFELRGKIIAFQEKYQVLNTVGTFLYNIAGRSEEEKLHQKVNTALLDKLVKEALTSPKPFSVNAELLKDWHSNIAYFKEKGTKLVFFEMPNDLRLVVTKERKSLRTLTHKEFPDISYVKEENSDGRYETGDGIHLTLKSAMEFTEVFKKNILDYFTKE